MFMNRSISAGMASLLAADVGTLAPVTNPIKMGLITTNFNPNPDLLIGDVDISAVPGLLPITGVVGPQNESLDPVTGENIVEVKEPLGGFRWETPEDFVPPVTVFGFALINNAGTTLFATQLLTPPVQLIAGNQALSAGPFQFRFDVTKVR